MENPNHSQGAVSPAVKSARIKVPVVMERGKPMFLKKVEGPRAVTLPDGTVMSRADLPPATTRRWVASRKAAVVRGVLYGLSEEEFKSWIAAVAEHGEEALKVTALKKYRQP